MPRLLIGNLLSFCSGVMLLVGSLTRQKKTVYLFQFLENVFLICSQFVFVQYTGVVSLLLSCARSLLVVREKYTFPCMLFFSTVTAVLGLSVNSGGAVGLLPVIAAVQFAVCAYYARTIVPTKITVLVNIAIWIVYAILILDISSAVFNSVAFLLTGYSLFSVRKRLRMQSAPDGTLPQPEDPGKPLPHEK